MYDCQLDVSPVTILILISTFTPRPLWLTWATMCTFQPFQNWNHFNYSHSRTESWNKVWPRWSQDGWLGKDFPLKRKLYYSIYLPLRTSQILISNCPSYLYCHRSTATSRNSRMRQFLVSCSTCCHLWCLCSFPVWFLWRDVEFKCILIKSKLVAAQQVLYSRIKVRLLDV